MKSEQVAIHPWVQTPIYGSNDTQFPLTQRELANRALDRLARVAVSHRVREDKRAIGAKCP